MDDSREIIRNTLAEVKTLLAQETVTRFSEADTKAYFIEPIIAALGWVGIGVVTREYYVKNSQEFIDYVLFGPGGPGSGQTPVMAIETKALQVDLTEKHAAQLIQYCAVEGIEWAALTNARELQFFNTFLKPDLPAKRVIRLDLLAFNSDEEFDILYEQLWQLSQESITTSGVRTWLNQLRLDKTVRETILNPSSPTIQQLRKILSDAEISATPLELVQWFRTHLVPYLARLQERSSRTDELVQPPKRSSIALSPIPQREANLGRNDPDVLLTALQQTMNERFPGIEWRTTSSYIAAAEQGKIFMPVLTRSRSSSLVIGLDLPDEISSTRLMDNANQFTWDRFRKIVTVRSLEEVDEDLLALISASRSRARTSRASAYHKVNLVQLVQSGVLPPDTELVFLRYREILARARVGMGGEIIWQGERFWNVSDRRFAALLGPSRVSINGWNLWHAELPTGRVKLADLRAAYIAQHGSTGHRLEDVS